MWSYNWLKFDLWSFQHDYIMQEPLPVHVLNLSVCVPGLSSRTINSHFLQRGLFSIPQVCSYLLKVHMRLINLLTIVCSLLNCMNFIVFENDGPCMKSLACITLHPPENIVFSVEIFWKLSSDKAVANAQHCFRLNRDYNEIALARQSAVSLPSKSQWVYPASKTLSLLDTSLKAKSKFQLAFWSFPVNGRSSTVYGFRPICVRKRYDFTGCLFILNYNIISTKD